MQDKLIIKHIYNNFIDEVDLNLIACGDNIFSFNEYEDIQIELSSVNGYIVSIECLSCIDCTTNLLISCDNNELKLSDGMSYIISRNSDDDISYRPSLYRVSVRKNNQNINCTFEVKYNYQLSSSGMDNIIIKINNFINGLSIDFFKSTPINNLSSNDIKSDYYLYQLLVKYEKKISMNSSIILTRLRSNIKSKISQHNIEKRQNLKTIKKNLISNTKTKIFNIHKSQTYNTPENIILKKYTYKILILLKQVVNDLEILIEEKQNKTAFLVKKKLETEIIEHLQTNSTIKRRITNQVISIGKDIDESSEWTNKFLEWRKANITSYNNIRRIVEAEELKNVSIDNKIIYSPVFIQNIEYSFFKYLHDLIISKLDNTHTKNGVDMFADKKSYLLFEIFGFIIIQNILKELGFSYKNSTVSDLFSFASDSLFEYTNNDLTVKINYDHYCEPFYINKNKDTIVNINSNNCKPDYIMSIYNSRNELTNVIVVEMKYRNLKYMIKPDVLTETDATLSDYSQLAYCGDSGLLRKGVVSEVILIYPSMEEKIFDRYSGQFVGINTELDFSISEGYIYLKDLLNSNIYNPNNLI